MAVMIRTPRQPRTMCAAIVVSSRNDADPTDVCVYRVSRILTARRRCRVRWIKSVGPILGVVKRANERASFARETARRDHAALEPCTPSGRQRLHADATTTGCRVDDAVLSEVDGNVVDSGSVAREEQQITLPELATVNGYR